MNAIGATEKTLRIVSSFMLFSCFQYPFPNMFQRIHLFIVLIYCFHHSIAYSHLPLYFHNLSIAGYIAIHSSPLLARVSNEWTIQSFTSRIFCPVIIFPFDARCIVMSPYYKCFVLRQDFHSIFSNFPPFSFL